MNEYLDVKYGDDLPFVDIGDWADLRRTIHDDLTAEAADESFPMKPQRVLNDVRSFMGPSDIVLSDVGAHKMWIGRYYQ